MKKVTLIKEIKPNGKKVYTAINENGEQLYKSSPTHRDYISIMVSDNGTALFRFGRIDLIGKGDSKYYFLGHACDYIAIIEEAKSLVFIPSKQDIFSYSFAMHNGNQVYQWATSESEARGSIERRAKSYCTTSYMMSKAKLIETKQVKF